MSQQGQPRQLPIGAEALPEGGVHFRVWAPRCGRVEVVLEGGPGYSADNPQGIALTPETSGYFSGHVAAAAVGTRYRFRLDGSDALYPDPASRFQPDGPHGPSQIVDPRHSSGPIGHGQASRWKGKSSMRCTSARSRRKAPGQRAARELPELAALGITVLEVMPVADFPAVSAGAMTASISLRRRGSMARRTIFAASSIARMRLGLGVILDVVYNHFGPDGNYLKQFSADYFTDRYTNDWGEAHQLRWRECRAGARVLSRQCRLLDRRISSRRLAARCDAADLRPVAEHILAAITRRVRAGRPAGAQPSSWRRTSRSTYSLVRPHEQGRLWARRALERRLSSQRHGGADRTQRGLLHRLSGARRRSSSRRSNGATSTRAMVYLAKAAPRHARHSG